MYFFFLARKGKIPPPLFPFPFPSYTLFVQTIYFLLHGGCSLILLVIPHQHCVCHCNNLVSGMEQEHQEDIFQTIVNYFTALEVTAVC
jgi:hypothetical protein